MNFLSDNAYGVAPEILEALGAANDGAVAPYGSDPFTTRLQKKMSEVFGRDVAVFPVATGTATNALALATLCPQHGAILCHADAHIVADECGAAEFFTHGARIAPIEGPHNKIAPEGITRALKKFFEGEVHHAKPSLVSITQSTERGTVYSVAETAAIAETAKKHKLKLHMDGARFANALAHLKCTPAEATWKAGVDALSFGATKNGALGAEAVVFFDPEDARDFEYRRMKGGHLFSKMRFVSAQLIAILEDNRWLTWALRANALAKRVADGLVTVPTVEIVHPVEANAVFARIPDKMVERLRSEGVHFYDWAMSEDGRTLARFMFSFATPEAEVERFLTLLKS